MNSINTDQSGCFGSLEAPPRFLLNTVLRKISLGWSFMPTHSPAKADWSSFCHLWTTLDSPSRKAALSHNTAGARNAVIPWTRYWESATGLQFHFSYWEEPFRSHSFSFLLCTFTSLSPFLDCSNIRERMISSPTQAPRVTWHSSVGTSGLYQSITLAARPHTELGSAVHATCQQDPRSPNRD